LTRRALRLLASLVPVVLVAGCLQDFGKFRGEGGAGGGGVGGEGGTDPCAGVDCDDDNPCTVDDCSGGTCTHVPGIATLPDPEDCKEQNCNDGELVITDDNTETPSDMNPCTVDTCAGGEPSHPNEPAGTTCNDDGVCDGRGTCSSCTVPLDCGADAPCGTRTCIANVCGWMFTAAGTVVGPGVEDDCQVEQCNGTSEIPEVVDGDDPLPDGDECTDDECLAGVPDYPDSAAGTVCNTTDVCDGAGDCVECILAPDCDTAGQVCLANNTCCTPESMTSACAGDTCGTVVNNCGQMVNCGTCSGGTPFCVNGDCEECAVSNDCLTNNDGHECLPGNVCGCDMANDCTGIPNATQCNTGTGVCVECTLDNQCNTNNDGHDCLPTNVCGCNENSPDCNGIAGATQCNLVTGLCVECTASGQCTTDPQGHACLPNNLCGCAVNTDCTGIGPATCNTLTGVCNP
jgi:hypothetical protein